MEKDNVGYDDVGNYVKLKLVSRYMQEWKRRADECQMKIYNTIADGDAYGDRRRTRRAYLVSLVATKYDSEDVDDALKCLVDRGWIEAAHQERREKIALGISRDRAGHARRVGSVMGEPTMEATKCVVGGCDAPVEYDGEMCTSCTLEIVVRDHKALRDARAREANREANRGANHGDIVDGLETVRRVDG